MLWESPKQVQNMEGKSLRRKKKCFCQDSCLIGDEIQEQGDLKINLSAIPAAM